MILECQHLAMWPILLYYCIDVRLSHCNKDYPGTYLLTYLA